MIPLISASQLAVYMIALFEPRVFVLQFRRMKIMDNSFIKQRRKKKKRPHMGGVSERLRQRSSSEWSEAFIHFLQGITQSLC
jgi:hypothetical protein